MAVIVVRVAARILGRCAFGGAALLVRSDRANHTVVFAVCTGQDVLSDAGGDCGSSRLARISVGVVDEPHLYDKRGVSFEFGIYFSRQGHGRLFLDGRTTKRWRRRPPRRSKLFFGNAGTHGVIVVVLVPDLVLANARREKLRVFAVVDVEHAVVRPAFIPCRRGRRVRAREEPGSHVLAVEGACR